MHIFHFTYIFTMNACVHEVASSRVRILVTPWTVALQGCLSV